MEILAICPGGFATGGTEGIHHLVSELNACGADAKILYVGGTQTEEFAGYNCPYITELPDGYDGTVIIPEIWGNSVVDPKYRNCIVAILWQGIDVYSWHVPEAERGLFLKRTDTIHITMSEYGMDYLRGLGLNPIKIPDCINDVFLQDFPEEYERGDTVLYNPTPGKLTRFQEIVMARCKTELGIKFLPLEGYSRTELIDLFRRSKLYIDFGVFSGRERLPREAVGCGCCILTSNKGTAGYYKDNTIPDKYKLIDMDSAVKMVRYVLDNYEECRPDFDLYRKVLRHDNKIYPKQVKSLYDEIFRHNPGS